VVLLLICLCTYIHTYAPTWLDAHKKGSVAAAAEEEIKATEQQQQPREGCALARRGGCWMVDGVALFVSGTVLTAFAFFCC